MIHEQKVLLFGAASKIQRAWIRRGQRVVRRARECELWNHVIRIQMAYRRHRLHQRVQQRSRSSRILFGVNAYSGSMRNVFCSAHGDGNHIKREMSGVGLWPRSQFAAMGGRRHGQRLVADEEEGGVQLVGIVGDMWQSDNDSSVSNITMKSKRKKR